MNISFLDVDGVLITQESMMKQYVRTGKPHSGHRLEFDPTCMENLKQFINETNSYIVISSTWRLGDHKTDKGWNVLMHRLDTYGLKDRVIGCTPNLGSYYVGHCCREHEIQKWLDVNFYKNIERFVIIDDCPMDNLVDNLARCSFKDGFTESVKSKAIEIMGREIEW